jgi:hypothetical protein
MGQADIGCGLVARLFDFKKDYAIIKDWWISHGSFPPKPEHLSTTGIVVEADKPVCAGWLYHTDSKICIFEFVVSDPKACKELRNDALNLLIEEAKRLSSERQYKLIYSSVKGVKYINRLKEAGFIEVDTDQTHCFFEVGNE